MLRPQLEARRVMAAAGVLREITWDEWCARGWSDDDEGGRLEWEDYNAHVRETAAEDHLRSVVPGVANAAERAR